MTKEKTYTETELRNILAEKIEDIKSKIADQKEQSSGWWFNLGKKSAFEHLLLNI